MEKPKIIAFHLPQYHTFQENDEWWGKGFTDWTNVRKAKPLYKGHYQPRVPLNQNYYNMLDYQTRKWQAETAQKYGVYGFCYYHYWFNGKLLMEKPVELLLNEPEISLPFCFCWANEPWSRAWDGSEKEIIMPQYYGGKIDWLNHINYLIPFFKDERYIKKDNKPVFVIYRSNSIDNVDEMIRYWNEECIKAGFAGVYIVEELNGFQKQVSTKISDAYLEFYPWRISFNHLPIFTKFKNIVRKLFFKIVFKVPNHMIFYDTIWNSILNTPSKSDNTKHHFLGALVGWDNTPRKGRDGYVCMDKSSPREFGKYFTKLVNKATEERIEYIFVNAWNEWAEGAYLEPDEKYGYGYLEEIKKAISGESDA